MFHGGCALTCTTRYKSHHPLHPGIVEFAFPSGRDNPVSSIAMATMLFRPLGITSEPQVLQEMESKIAPSNLLPET